MGGVESGVSTQCVWFALHLLARPNSHMYMDNHCVRLSFKLLLCRLYNMYILPRRLKYKISSLVDFSRNQLPTPEYLDFLFVYEGLYPPYWFFEICFPNILVPTDTINFSRI